MYDKNKTKYIKKKNIYYRPWGKYTNLFEGKEFLIKELYVKPKEAKAKQIIKNKGYWNSGMFYLRKDSIINNFKKYQPKTYRNCINACLLYTSPSPRDATLSRMPSSA